MSEPAAANPSPSPAPSPAPAPEAIQTRVQAILGHEAVWEKQGQLPAFRLAPDQIHSAGQKMRAAGFDYLLLVTAVDYPAENRFELVYVLTNFTQAEEVALVADVNRQDPHLETVSDIWETADWHEREVFDLYGVRFDHHRDLRRILLDNTWEGYPLRKDYVDTVHDLIKRPY
jgi:NADH-quinone oxidoreductase subunit C